MLIGENKSLDLRMEFLLNYFEICRRIEDLDFYVYRYQAYGKNFIKSCKVSPDVYIQLALQLAYYKYELVILIY